MAIQMRRGLSKDFDPSSLREGEWAVCIDPETEKQIVYMCFSPGVVKRIGTYEDLKEQLESAELFAELSESFAKQSESYAVGGTGTREGEDTDNAKYYMEHAKAIVGIDIATTEKAGIVKPDGKSISVDKNGVISSDIPSVKGNDSSIKSVESNLLIDRIYGMSEQGSYNLIPFPYFNTDRTTNGITFKTNSDGSVTANGTATAAAVFVIYYDVPIVQKGKKYIISDGFNSDEARIVLQYRLDGNRVYEQVATPENIIVEPPTNIEYNQSYIGLWVKTGATVNNITYYPMIAEVNPDGSYPTEFVKGYGQPSADNNVEIVSVGEVEDIVPSKKVLPISVRNKNLIPFPYADMSKTVNGITYKINDDGSVIANGTATAEANINLTAYSSEYKPLKKGKKYFLSGGKSSNKRVRAFSGVTSGIYTLGNDTGNGVLLNYVEETIDMDYNVRFIITIASGQVCNNDIFYPMLVEVSEDGSYPTEYEIYKSQLATLGITLRAIEVTASDEYNLVKNGRYYIADTLDLIDDKYIITRRIGYQEGGNVGWVGIRTTTSQFNISLKEIVKVSARKYTISNRFLYSATALSDYVKNTMGTSTTRTDLICVMLDGTNYNMSTAQAWVNENKPVFQYIKETPTTEELSEEDLNSLLSIKSYNDRTYIEQLGVKSELDIEYANSQIHHKAIEGYVNSLKLDELPEKISEINDSLSNQLLNNATLVTTDLNDLPDGIVTISSGVANAPDPTFIGMVITKIAPNNTNQRVQIALQFNTHNLFIRQRYGSSYGSWAKATLTTI